MPFQSYFGVSGNFSVIVREAFRKVEALEYFRYIQYILKFGILVIYSSAQIVFFDFFRLPLRFCGIQGVLIYCFSRRKRMF